MSQHPDTSSSFDAIVVSSKVHAINPQGEKVVIAGWMADSTRHLPAAGFAALQEAYDGALEIVNGRSQILVHVVITAFSSKHVREQLRTMASRIREHLSIVATVQ